MTASSPPRIAAATCDLVLGGASTFLLNFSRVLPPEEGSLRIVCFARENGLTADFAATGAEVLTGDVGHLIYEDRLAWGYGQIAAWQPQAVIASLGAESFEMLRLAPPGVVRIGVIQSDDPPPYQMARRYHASLDAMVGVSATICARLRAIPEFARTRIVEIPYGISFGEARPREAFTPRRELRVLYLGRLVEVQKRVSRLVALIQHLERQTTGIRFTFAGTGPAEAEMKEALAGSKIVRFLGSVPNSDVPELLSTQDVYILLSDFEGLPLSLLEAMGAGVVPVISDLPSGIRDTVTAAEGIRVPVGDVPAAAEAILALQRDPGRVTALSAGAQARARRDYPASLMVERYLELIRTIAPAGLQPAWPQRAKIPAPHGVSKWLFSGFPRWARRKLKARRQVVSR